MESGTYPFTYSNLPTLDGGWADFWQQDSLAHPHDFQVSEEAGSLISCGADPLYQLMWMFRPIPPVSIYRYSLVLLRGSTAVGQKTLDALPSWYEGFLQPLEYLCLTK